MLRKRWFGFILLLAVIVVSGCSNVGSAAKENNSSSVTAAPPAENTKDSAAVPEQRVVSTTVAITEMMAALEVDLVGVPTSSKVLPARYDAVTKIGNPMSPDMELVKSLKPT